MSGVTGASPEVPPIGASGAQESVARILAIIAEMASKGEMPSDRYSELVILFAKLSDDAKKKVLTILRTMGENSHIPSELRGEAAKIGKNLLDFPVGDEGYKAEMQKGFEVVKTQLTASTSLAPPASAVPIEEAHAVVVGQPPAKSAVRTEQVYDQTVTKQAEEKQVKYDELLVLFKTIVLNRPFRLNPSTIKLERRSQLAQIFSYWAVDQKDKATVSQLMRAVDEMCADPTITVPKRTELLRQVNVAKRNNPWLNSVLKKYPQVDSVHRMVQEASDKPDDVSLRKAAYTAIKEAAGRATTKQQMESLEALYMSMSLQPGKVEKSSVREVKEAALLALTRLPIIHTIDIPPDFKDILGKNNPTVQLTPDMLVRDAAKLVKTWVAQKDRPAERRPEHAKVVRQAYEQMYVDKPQGVLTQEGVHAAEQVFVIEPALPVPTELSCAYLTGRKSTEHPSPESEVTAGHELLPQALTMGVATVSAPVIYRGRDVSPVNISSEGKVQEFIFLNVANLDFEDDDAGGTKYLIGKPSPAEKQHAPETPQFRLTHPIRFATREKPPKRLKSMVPGSKEAIRYSKEVAEYSIGLYAKNRPVEVTEVYSVTHALEVMQAMITRKPPVSLSEIEDTFRGLGIQVAGGIVPAEVLFGARFAAMKQAFGAKESMGDAAGKKYVHEVSTPVAFANRLCPGDPPSPLGGQLINRLDLLSVRALQAAGETFPQLGVVVVDGYNDGDNLTLWRNCFPDRPVVDYNDTVDKPDVASTPCSLKTECTDPRAGRGNIDFRKFLAWFKNRQNRVTRPHFGMTIRFLKQPDIREVTRRGFKLPVEAA